MSQPAITLEMHDKVALLTLSRPQELNTMNAEFWQQLPRLLQDIDQTASARAIVLASTGKHFCAGMDLAVFSQLSQPQQALEVARRHENMLHTVQQLQQVFSQLEQVRMPVLAAVQGGCIGGALDMISACDMRYCTRDAFFTIEEIKLGMTADLGSLQRLPHLIPEGLVRELAYTGRRLMADEALQAGLVNKVYDNQADMLDGVMAIAQQIASHSPIAVAGCKQMLNYSRDHSVDDSLKMMAVWQSGMFQPQSELQRAITAKMEKTAPEYEDLAPTTLPIQTSDK